MNFHKKNTVQNVAFDLYNSQNIHELQMAILAIEDIEISSENFTVSCSNWPLNNRKKSALVYFDKSEK
jgi:hypothetical protein